MYLPDILKKIPHKKRTVKEIRGCVKKHQKEGKKIIERTLTGKRATGLYHNILRMNEINTNEYEK